MSLRALNIHVGPAGKFRPGSINTALAILLVTAAAVFSAIISHSHVSANRQIHNAGSPTHFQPVRLSANIRQSGPMDPAVALRSPQELPNIYRGPADLQYALEQNLATPRALASADFDEDGVPDLIGGYAYFGRGIVTLHRGNVDSIYPNAPEAQARKANGTFTKTPFLSPALAIGIATPIDFVGTGDFDADGHWDIVSASRAGTSLVFLAGNGHGEFGPAEALELPGKLTAFLAADVNRRDGLTDIVIGVNSFQGPSLVIFESPLGARKAQPETIPLPAEASGLAVGELDDEYEFDVAVTAGRELLIVHGRDRKISLPPEAQAGVELPEVTQRDFAFALKDVAIGDFDGDSLSDLALLGVDGDVRLLTRPQPTQQKINAAVAAWPAENLSSVSWPGTTGLTVARISSASTDDLILMEPAKRSLRIATRDAKQGDGAEPREVITSMELAGGPFTVLPMRLDEDALSDLVILRDGSSSPTALRTGPTSGNGTESVTSAEGVFSNTSPTTIPSSGSDTRGSPYPSTITVSGLTGTIDKLRVRLNNLTHGFIPDVDMLLVGPGGQKMILVSDVGSNQSVNNLTLSLDDSAPGGVPAPATSGSYKPTDNGAGDTFAAPAPAGPYNDPAPAGAATFASVFNGIDPNGTWSLYVVDDSPGLSGGSLGGWSLIFGDPPGTTFVVTNTNDSGAGSLRQAIIDSNNNPGTDTITFNIPAAGVQTITPSSALPTIFDPVTIDATTQPGFAGQPLIELAGNSAGAGSYGFTITGGRTTVRGFVINRFNGGGILIHSSGNNIIEGNYIGTNSAGTAASANGYGINLGNVGNKIGGTTTAARNVISGNTSTGVLLSTQFGSVSQTTIQGNYIGTNAAGTARVQNGQQGISTRSANGSPNNTIGGTTAGAGNVVSGHNGNVDLVYPNTNGTLIQGNFIGTNAAGTASLSGGFGDGIGISAASHDNTIGGTTPAARNIISGNIGSGAGGVFIREESSTANLVQGNFIGTDATGTLQVGNYIGVLMIFSAAGNTIGGDALTVPGVRNIISANTRAGIQIGEVNRSTTLFNLIRGNYIGTDVTGGNPLGNGLNATFGGDGIIIPANATGDTIQENRIAYNTGSAFFGTGNGIRIETPSSGTDNPGIQIQIIDNEIFGNSRLGIDLGALGITPNDAGDGDIGPNNLQNFPVLTGFVPSGTADLEGGNSPDSHGETITVNGTLNSMAGTSYTVHWYFSTDSVCGNNQESTRPLAYGHIPGVTTDGSGNAAFSFPFTFPPGTSAGIINCTATDSLGNTSEFSACMPVNEVPPTLSIGEVAQAESNSGSVSFTFTVSLSIASSQTVTVNYATANGTASTADGDYSSTSGTLTFTPGQTSKLITVTVNGDSKFEPDETFFVNLSTPTNATINDSQGQGTIQNDDSQPTISINDLSQNEGNAGPTSYTFTATLSNTSSQTITVNYAAADGTATTANGDYSAISGSLTFNPGDSSKPITVQVNGDTTFEPNENFVVNLSTPTNATINDSQGQGTIQNDDSQPTISINDVTANEGNSGTTTFTFTVSLTNASSQTISVNYTTANGTATAGSDYQSANATLSFNPGDTSKSVAVLVNGDTLNELDEGFVVNLSGATNATITDTQGAGTITNDDAVPSLSINDVGVAEGNSGTTNATFTVSLSAASGRTVTVNYATANSSAVAGSDYQSTSGTLTFNPGEPSKSITVLVNGDTANETDETFLVNLSGAVNASIADNQGVGTILNDDGAPSLAINDLSVNEGNSGTTSATFTVSLSPASGQTVTLQFATADGTALATSDYQGAAGSLTFNPGDTSKPITVLVNGDALNEPNETFLVNLSNATNATIVDSQGLGTITNDDLPPQLSINDVSVSEGNSGTASATFTVSLSTPSAQTVTVNYATADGTGTTTDNDYVSSNGALTFNPGDTSKPITIVVNGDTKFEPGETFLVNLSSPANATVSDGQGQGTILNDDLQPTLAINDVTQGEGNSGSAAFVFSVSLSNTSSQAITVNYATVNGTAVSTSDYQSTSGLLTFNPGDTMKTINVVVNGDALNELDETFFVNLSSAANATIADGQGLGTITNDDAVPSLSINDVGVAEGNAETTNATLDVSLSAPSGRTVTVQYATADNTANSGSDYQSTSGTLTFNPGDTNKSITVAVNGDNINEPNETFLVNLSNPANATIADSQGQGTITNDDSLPSISVDDVTANEGNSGTTSFTFTVGLSNPSSQSVSVNYATANGTATAGSDYQSVSGTLTFNPGDTSKSVTVLVNGDTLNEPVETFVLNLSNAGNATIADNQGLGTISNDDAVPGLSINDVGVAEGNGGTTNVTFTVSLATASGQTVSVNYTAADGTATTADNDYQSSSGSLTFNPGDTSKSITVLVNGDTANEPNETFFVNLTGAVNATIADSQGIGTILNDDGAPTLSINDLTVIEGNSSTTNATFTVTLSPASGQTVTVNYATADGNAIAGSDYQSISGSLTFNSGDTSKSVTVLVNGDTLNEPNEGFFVNLSNGNNAIILDAQGAGTIENDDGAPQLVVDDVSVTEGNSGTAAAIFTVSMSTISGQTVTINYATADGTAIAGSDYQSDSGSLMFNPGETSKSITLLVSGDNVFEPDETFLVNLSSPVNATIGDGQGQGTIQNDDSQPTLTISDVGQGEGHSGTALFMFTVSLSNASSQTITVNYATADDTATSGGDYQTTSGVLTFNSGDVSKSINVLVNGDALNEPDEMFFVNLSGATNAGIADNQGAGTILNDDGLPALAINDVSVTEGNGGSTIAMFAVTLSDPSGQTVTVQYATADGSAEAGSDYQSASDTLTFGPGETLKTINVTVNGDATTETNETFFVNLSNASNANVADSQGVGTINNDDSVPGISVNDISANEGNSGTTSFTFIVNLSNASSQTITVNYASSDSTATAGSDYQNAIGTLTFDPGETSQPINLLVNGDLLHEVDETFVVNLSSAANATIADDQGVGTIVNDDAAPTPTPTPTPTATPTPTPTPTPTATPTPDGYTPTGSNVTVQGNGVEIIFAQVDTAGVTTMSFIPPPNAGTLPSGYVINGSSIAFNISTTAGYTPPVNLCFEMASVTDPTAFGVLAVMHNEGGTLVDRTTSHDFATKKVCGRVDSLSPFAVVSKIALQYSAATYNDAENVGSVSVTVIRTSDSSGAAAINYATSDSAGASNCNVLNSGFANSRCDYETTVGTLHFAAGETTKTILIPIVDDVYAEGSEAFTVTLSNASGALLGSPSVANVTIGDNETTTGTNPINQADFFVRLHYIDFFTREPDAGGLSFWTNQITECGSNQACVEIRRINVSAAFYLSIEFQGTGYLVERIYKSAYGNGSGTSTLGGTHQLAVPIVRFNEFLPDTQQIGQGVVVGQPGWEAKLESNKVAFLAEFVTRSRFTSSFPGSMTAAQFVDTLNANAGNPLSAAERNQLVNELQTGVKTRAQVLRAVAEDSDLVNSESNRAFVLMQFYGYLRRNPNDAPDPDYTGYDFWLGKLNQFNGNFVNAEMVKAFIVSGEYKQRFGP